MLSRKYARISTAIAITAAVILAVWFGCSKPSGPASTAGKIDAFPDRTSARALLEGYFPAVYSARDSAAYEAMLDDAYLFYPVEEGDDAPAEPWHKREELKITGRMFHGWKAANGMSVQSIDLAIAVQSVVEDNSVDPARPEGEAWYRALCRIELTIMMVKGEEEDPVGIPIRSAQEFVVRPDPDKAGSWVVVRQFDRMPGA